MYANKIDVENNRKKRYLVFTFLSSTPNDTKTDIKTVES